MTAPDEAAVPPNGSTPTGWLLLIYRVPSEPTRLRATVWRRLKGLGAIYLQNSAAALPAGPAPNVHCAYARDPRNVGHRVPAELLVLAGEATIKAAFQAARNKQEGDRRQVPGLRRRPAQGVPQGALHLRRLDEDLIKLPELVRQDQGPRRLRRAGAAGLRGLPGGL